MITLKTARQIASEWHSGQTSPLYSFASTGGIFFPLEDYLQELALCKPEEGPGCWEARSRLANLEEYLRAEAGPREVPACTLYRLARALETAGLPLSPGQASSIRQELQALAEGVESC